MSARPYQESRQRFERDTANHEMKVLRDDGLYRHLRFNEPGTYCMGFDIITWPGYLVICGDVETYVFAREADMFDWIQGRGEPRSEISPDYWAQKLQGDRRGRDISRRYSHEAFRAQMLEWARMECEAAEFEGVLMYESLLIEAVEREVLAEYTTHEEAARELIRDLEDEGVITGETWEWDLKDFDHFFLWCCHAILWGIEQYAALAEKTAADAEPSIEPGRLKRWRRRWLLWARGECENEGCAEPRMQYFSRCSEHTAIDWQETAKRIAAEKFEREVQIHAEALRRVFPTVELKGAIDRG